MKIKKWKVYAVFVAICEAVGILSALISRQGMQVYETQMQKPPLSPPGWVFAVVWPILYGLMGFGAARIWLADDTTGRKKGLNLFVTQLIVNFFWSLIFFVLRGYGLAFLWILALLGLVVWMTYEFYKVEKFAGLLQLPYIIWLFFAAYLSGGAWLINK